MANEVKDYYKTIGVEKNASQDEIKKAFRKLARKYHPDLNPGDKTSEQKFKELNNAPLCLSIIEYAFVKPILPPFSLFVKYRLYAFRRRLSGKSDRGRYRKASLFLPHVCVPCNIVRKYFLI